MASFPTQNLTPGMSGDQVKQLQQYLIDKGYSIPYGVTGYYGDQTKAAVLQLQKDLGVDYSSGPGYWGPKTISTVQSGATPGGPYQFPNAGYVNTQPNLKTNQPVSTQSPAPTSPAPISTDTSGTIDTGGGLSDQEQSILGSVQKMLDDIKSRGQQINPYVTVSPQTLASLVDQARTELGPYYDSQLKLAKDALLGSLGYSANEVQQAEKQYQTQYGRQLTNLGENVAERGFAQSGIRQLGEQQLAQDIQAQIDAQRRQLKFQAGQAASQFAQTYGGANLPIAPGISQAPRVIPGQEAFNFNPYNFPGNPQQPLYGFPSGNLNSPLYQLSQDVYGSLTGTQQKEQELAARTLGSQYAQAKSQEALGQQYQQLTGSRQLTI